VASVVDPLTDRQADLTNLGHWHNPVAPSGAGQLASALAFLGHIPLSLVATVLIVRLLMSRWRNGDALRRQQLKLFVAAAALPLVAVPIAFGVGGDTGTWIFGLAALPLPFAIGFAVLARGLYDLRTAVNRGLVWLTLSGLVAGLYALIIAGVGSRFDAGKAAWLAWVAAAAVALSFSPLRDVLQRGVNRLTFGRWDEPYEVIAGLGQRLEASSHVRGLLVEVVDELHALGLTKVAILDAHDALVAGARLDPDDDTASIGLSAYGRPVGQLRYRPPATPLRARDRRLLDDLAGHLGGVLHAYQLTGDLQRALERTVLAREEERRRLRRELHDGLGPALAGHLLRLDVIAAKLAPSAASNGLGADVDSLRGDLRNTVVEVRRVVEGLRPAALDELGLPGALSQVAARLSAGTALTVELDVATLPPLSAALEVAAFRIITEAVTNTVRHSQATTCRVGLETRDGQLHLTVADNGQGFDPASPNGGNGLHTMRERAEELRGQLRVNSPPGTTVMAELPIGGP
jgi:signal transduction histidine kinase